VVRTKFVEKIKTHFMFSKFFSKIFPFGANVDKRCTAGGATDDNISRRMLDY
jgi:hypothetical protein